VVAEEPLGTLLDLMALAVVEVAQILTFLEMQHQVAEAVEVWV
jgi:hypothetical protein